MNMAPWMVEAEAEATEAQPWDDVNAWQPEWVDDWGEEPEVTEEAKPPALRPLNAYQRKLFVKLISGVSSIGTRGGWGSSKTSTQAIALMWICLTRPGARCMWVTDTSKRRDAVLQVEAEKFWPEVGAIFQASKQRWVFPNGSVVWLREYFRPSTKAATANPLEGPTLHAIAIDECQMFPGREVADKAAGRLRQPVTFRGEEYRPLLILAGLPVPDAWWMEWVAKEGGACFYPTSYVNQANLDPSYLADLQRRLDPEEYEAFVMNKPRPPRGMVYREWSSDSWPAGNVLDDYVPDPDVPITLAIDFGLMPAVLFIQHDAARNLDIIIDEIALDDCEIWAWVPILLSKAWPIGERWTVPDDGKQRFWIGGGYGDKAGSSRDTHGRDDISWLANPPPKGVGTFVQKTTDPLKVDPANGIRRVKRLILDPETGHRQLVIMRKLWESGRKAEEARTFARAILNYKYKDDGSGRVHKDGRWDHHMDALRYFAIGARWFWSLLDGLEGRLAKAIAKANKGDDLERLLNSTMPPRGPGRPQGV